ncbi:MAG: S1 family peptidase [Nitrospiraceae bacterium]
MRTRRFESVAILLLVIAVSFPAVAQERVLSQPDRRAIPMLISQNRDLLKYGTGVVVGRDTVLTAEHVAAADKLVIRFPKVSVAGRAVCRARYQDLAVVRASLPKGTPYYRMSFRTPAVGEKVMVAGYPQRKWQVRTGRISHVISSAVLSGRRVNAPMIVFKPALHSGASGAPVLDGRGRVIGIFVASNRQSNYSIAFPTATSLNACRKFVG